MSMRIFRSARLISCEAFDREQRNGSTMWSKFNQTRCQERVQRFGDFFRPGPKEIGEFRTSALHHGFLPWFSQLRQQVGQPAANG